MLGFTQQRGEARRRIETRPAQPIDRAVAADQGRRLAVADQSVVFDAKRHGFSLTWWELLPRLRTPGMISSSASGVAAITGLPGGTFRAGAAQIGRASCRGRVWIRVGGVG